MKDKSQRKHVFTTEQVTAYSRHVPGKNTSHTWSDTDARLCFVLDALSSILFLCFGRVRSFMLFLL
jgi:hypothetical protein